MKVILLASTQLTDAYIRHIYNDLQWSTDAKTDGDELVEYAGRLCYRSWHPGDNKNVTKTREGNQPYVGNILKQGHGSVLEHVTATFLLSGVSRVLTHELVRHRAGTAFSQESLRYVRIEDFQVALPPNPFIIEKDRKLVDSVIETIRSALVELGESTGIDSCKFNIKKQITSWLRRIVPMGIETNIVFTANVRALRHIISMRTSPAAEIEIREVFGEVARLCQDEFPALFQDMTYKDGAYTFGSEKV